jgi:hypothetical protein
MGLGMEGDDFYYWTLKTYAWRLEWGLDSGFFFFDKGTKNLF